MRTTRLYNDHWTFTKRPLDQAEAPIPPVEAFLPVELPHDWLIWNTPDLYEDGEGLYRKLHRHEPDASSLASAERTVLRFDGIYMDSRVFVNGTLAKEWKYGYSTFEADITPFLAPGENEILVRVRHQSPNTRWYAGAGIYRNVWLKRTPAAHLVSDGIYAVSAPAAKAEEPTALAHAASAGAAAWTVSIGTEVALPPSLSPAAFSIRHTLIAPDGTIAACATGPALHAPDAAERARLQAESATAQLEAPAAIDHQTVSVSDPQRWDIDAPVLYTLRTELLAFGAPIDAEEQPIGFRTTEFLPEEGFLLNGRKVRLNGVCQHHDLGCLGAAVHLPALRRQLDILRTMGVNAIRTSHNMPAPELMALCDEMGLLVVSEAFDMWERPKTEYDYARFFPQWMPADVASWVRRDRNRPSLILWSIGNEIHDTHADARGQEVTRMLLAEVERHDPMRNARVTIGSNYMPWENAQKCADIVKMAGYNYADRLYEAHHAAHPDWVIYGSETASTVQSRGVYHFPLAQSVLSDEDEQCSALGNSTTSWGARTSEACILADRDTPFSMGQFIWTGFDYIGEPTPYRTKNSYFGQIDTAGFPKDQYWIYRAAWTDPRKAPFVHVFPHWDFSPGEVIDVRAVSNCPRVALFCNDEPIGSVDIDRLHGTHFGGAWQVPYREGVLRAVAYDEAGTEVATCIRSSFGDAARLVLSADREHLMADGQDLLFVTIAAEDARGRPVENANNRVVVQVSGAGRLVGLDNGDSTDFEPYKGTSRRLFSGRLLAVVAATHEAGDITVKVSSPGLPDAVLARRAFPGNPIAGASDTLAHNDEAAVRDGRFSLTGAVPPAYPEDEVPVRMIEIRSPSGFALTPEQPAVSLEALLHPANATWREASWRVTNDAGVDSWNAVIEPEGRHAVLHAKGDGTVRVRCTTTNGSAKTKLISELAFTISGFGEALVDPYAFIAGALYDRSNSEMGNGNNHGVATLRETESHVGFSRLDFGDYGSDEVTLPIFAMDPAPFPIEIWEGMPGEPGSEKLLTETYTRGAIWDIYQEQAFRLPRRLRGVTTVCFVVRRKIHLAGFRFTRPDKARATIPATEAAHISGDTFTRTEDAVLEIGNNVALDFGAFDFGEAGASHLVICGRSDLDINSIHVQFTDADGTDSTRQLCEFERATAYTERRFDFAPVHGRQQVTFIFLHGCRFDFRWFRFEA